MAFLLIALWLTDNAAATSIPTPPNLTAAQWLEIKVSSSDAVVIARVTGARESTATIPYPPAISRQGDVVSQGYVYIDIFDVVKGDSSLTRARVLVPNFSFRPLESLAAGTNDSAVFFLVDSYYGWTLIDRLALPRDELAAMRTRLRSLVVAQSLDTVASAAPIAIRGTFKSRNDCAGPSGPTTCLRFGVDSVLVGYVDAAEVSVICPAPAALSYGKAIVFLTPTTNQLYALVGSNAGIVPIEDRQGVPLRRDLEQLLARIRAAAIPPHGKSK